MQINGEMRFLANRGDAVEMVAQALEMFAALGRLCAAPQIEVILRPGGAAPVLPEVDPTITRAGVIVETPAQVEAAPAVERAPGWSRNLVTVSAEDVIHAAQNGNGGRPLVMVAGRPWSQIAKAARPQAVDAHGAALTMQLGHGLAMSEWDAHRPAEWPAAASLPKTYASSWAELRDRWIQAAAAAAS